MPLFDPILDEAVRRGIISAAQRDQLVALAASAEARGLPDSEADPDAAERAPAIVATYAAGALAVLFAFGWFLVERWERLGPGGILVLVLLYAVIFGVTAWWLTRERFPLAASFAALLAVGMMPIATWAVLELAGLWRGVPHGSAAGPSLYGAEVLPTRWAVVELTTALAALLVYRKVPFAPLALPVAIAGWLAPLHLAAPFVDPLIVSRLAGWGSLATGAGLLMAAHAVERRTGVAEPAATGLAFDAAGWVYRVAVVALVFGVITTWDDSAVVRHSLLPLALVGAVLALSLGRRELLGASAFAFLAYLGYLAFDVFQRVLSFPIVLATVGMVLILLAVMVQRRWPELSARLAAARAGPRRLPGGYLLPGAVFAFMLLLLVRAPAVATEGMWREHREHLASIRRRGDFRRQQDGARRPRPVQRTGPRPETSPLPQP